MRYLITEPQAYRQFRPRTDGWVDSLGHECTQVTVFDKLTYAGNQANLASSPTTRATPSSTETSATGICLTKCSPGTMW